MPPLLIVVEFCFAGLHKLGEDSQGVADGRSIEHTQNGILHSKVKLYIYSHHHLLVLYRPSVGDPDPVDRHYLARSGTAARLMKKISITSSVHVKFTN
jgi:hypothetical protein